MTSHRKYSDVTYGDVAVVLMSRASTTSYPSVHSKLYSRFENAQAATWDRLLTAPNSQQTAAHNIRGHFTRWRANNSAIEEQGGASDVICRTFTDLHYQTSCCR